MHTTALITRHGLSEHNLITDRYMGRSPASRLVAEGREQARLLGRRLAREGGLEHIVCSSLPRTVETGELIAEEVGLPGIDRDDAFWELSKGSWENAMPRGALPAEVAHALAADPFGFRYPEGESYSDVTLRAGAAFDRWVGDHSGRKLLFVLHGDVIRALLYHLLRFPPEKIGDFVIDACSLTEFRVSGRRRVLVRFNDDRHLEPALRGLAAHASQ